MNTDNEKNISITLRQPENRQGKIPIGAFVCQLKRFFSLWLALAVALGAITAGIMLILNKTMNEQSIKALIGFQYKGIEQGLDPAGNDFDVSKLKSPGIIEDALSGLDESYSAEDVRRCITIEGVIPDKALDEMSLYKGIYTRSGSMDAAQKLLNIKYYPTCYTVSFDSSSMGISTEQGKIILNNVLGKYQEYFYRTYGYSETLGSSISAIDYKEYDYPAAVDIFRTTLDDLENYVANLQSTDTTSFRSSKTGYNFDDLSRNIETLRSSDLDSLSAFITINNAFKNKEQLISYYEYKIDTLEREAETQKSELDAISDSIDSYKKDTMMVFSSGDKSSKEYSQISAKYDELIENKILAQNSYSLSRQRIEYYKLRLNNLKNTDESSEEELTGAKNAQVEERIEELYQKINSLIEITEKTSDDYYENVVFENAFDILVPASGGENEVRLVSIVQNIAVVEAVLLAVYLGAAFVTGLNLNKKISVQDRY